MIWIALLRKKWIIVELFVAVLTLIDSCLTSDNWKKVKFSKPYKIQYKTANRKQQWNKSPKTRSAKTNQFNLHILSQENKALSLFYSSIDEAF